MADKMYGETINVRKDGWNGRVNRTTDEANETNYNQDPKHKLKQKYVNLNNFYSPTNNEQHHPRDELTGNRVRVYTIADAIRLGRRGDISNDSVITNKIIPDYLLGQFVVRSGWRFNARSSVEALGLFTTEYIKQQLTRLGDKNSDLGQMEDKTVFNDITFRTYIRGGDVPRDPVTGKPAETSEAADEYEKSYKRFAPHLGIGLGEASVLNPTFQFNKRDDVRTNPMYTKIGRVYSTQIMNNWPVILFQPGRLKYNTGFFKLLGLGGGAGIAESFIRSGGEGIVGALANFFSGITDTLAVVGTIGSAILGGGKLVEFRQAANLYNKYVSMLWIQMAQLMGLYPPITTDGKYAYSGEIKALDVTHVLPTLKMNGGFASYLNNQFIPFRCHKGMVGNESFSNSTESNPLMEEMNATATQNAEEGANQGNLAKSAVNWVIKKAGIFSDKAAVLSGQGRISLPDVYSSSSFQRSISCSFTFHYPYGDAMGKFENTLLQYLAILAMGLPRQTGKLTYTSPFAIRAYVKNHIMINYGMIESITVTRGGDSNDWGPDGYPKTLKVDVSIKDMEPNISLPLAARGPLRFALEQMFPTSGLSEYLETIGGLSLDQMTNRFRKENLTRAVGTFRAAWSQKLMPENMLASIANTRVVSNIMMLFRGADLEKMHKLGDINNMYNVNNAEAMAKNNFVMPFMPGFLQAAFDNDPSGNGGLKAMAESQRADKSSLDQISENIKLAWLGAKEALQYVKIL